ncbi:MAG: hypothetical protein ACRDGD_00280 [Candidatus Limnocylindria bacterium]
MPTATLRDARVGDELPSSLIDRRRARRLDATAILLPGSGLTDAYLRALESRTDDFAAWDGHIEVAEADGARTHRLLIVDRYGQVYAVTDAADVADLPDADALEEWFRFLATACPECGVIDDPLLGGPTL